MSFPIVFFTPFPDNSLSLLKSGKYELLFRGDALFIAYLLEANVFNNAAGSRMLTNLEPDIYLGQDIPHPEDYHKEDTGEEGKEDHEEEEEENV